MKLAALALTALLVVGSALAHHSPIVFDRTRQVTLTGTVTEFRWGNPHSWIHMDVKNADGSTTRWMIEGGTPNTLMRQGITKKSLPIGVEILVDGYRAKDGSNRANGRDVTFPDGRKLFLDSSGPERGTSGSSQK